MLRTFKKIPLVAFIVTLFVFTFFYVETSDPYLENPVVWYINGTPAIYSFFLLTVFSILTFFVKGVKPDAIFICLLLRCVICLVPLLYIDDSSTFSTHYPVVIVSLLSYYLGYNLVNDDKTTLRLVLIVFAIILTIQVILTFKLIDVIFLDMRYKQFMVIPIAKSNVIAAFLSPIIWLVLLSKDKKILKIALSVFIFVGILLTKSRGGLLCLLLSYLVYYSFVKKRFRLYRLIIPLFVFGVLFYYLLQIPEVNYFMLGYSAENDSSMTSGRLTIFGKEFHRALKHPFFGNGMVFNKDTSSAGSHNLIIELFVQSGLFGLLTYIIPVIIVIKRGYKKIKVGEGAVWFVFIVAILLHGMEEVNFFNYSTDMIFWFVCGTIMSKEYCINKRTPSYESGGLVVPNNGVTPTGN